MASGQERIENTIIFYLKERHGIVREKNPVRLGIPCPKGWLFDKSIVCLIGHNHEQIWPQCRTLAIWPDGSIKWLLLNFFISLAAHEQKSFGLIQQENPGKKENIFYQSRGDLLEINTGQAQFVIDKTKDIIFSKYHFRNQKEFISSSKIIFVDSKGVGCSPEDITWEIEEEGDALLTLKSRGKIWDSNRTRTLEIWARQNFFAGRPIVTTDITVHNPGAAHHAGGKWDLGDSGSFFFKELAINLRPALPLTGVECQVESIVPQYRTCPGWYLYQDSSGGLQWDSINHVDCQGRITTKFPGYCYGNSKDEQFGGGKGQRATPRVKAENARGWMEFSFEGFWQNFPKSISVEDKEIILGLFPQQSPQLYELQAGEQKRHSFTWEFGQPNVHSSGVNDEKLEWQLEPSWVERTKAIPYFCPQQEDKNSDYLHYINHCIHGDKSFFKRREIIDEYGWRNFGDLYADHEAVGYEGEGLFVSHYNNQYDFIFGALNHFLRGGDQGWWQLAHDLSRHVIDIDIYRTDNDKSSYNNGLFWHTDHYKNAATASHRTYSKKMYAADGGDSGGGPSNENNYTSGLLIYYYLTGDSLAGETVQGLADWVVAMDDGTLTAFALVDQGATGLASQTVAIDFHNPGRGAGNSINTLLDGFRLTGKTTYLHKADELIKRCIHPDDDIASLELMQPEYRWSYLVFLQILGKYLDLQVELGAFGHNFYYTRESLLHYAEWMAENEEPYFDILDRVEIPTETWPAHDIRKSHVFHLAAQYADSTKKQVFVDKADFFFKHALQDVLRFETAYLTRPLVILTVYGAMHSCFQKNGHQKLDYDQPFYDFGAPVKFIPQQIRAKENFSRNLKVSCREILRKIKQKFPWY